MARSKTPPRPLRPLREAHLLRMGRSPAEIAEGAEDNWEGKRSCIRAVYATALLCQKRIPPNPPPKKKHESRAGPHPHPWPGRKRHRASAPLREALRIRMGRSPAEIAEDAEDSLEWSDADSSELFSATTLVCQKRIPQNPHTKKTWTTGRTLPPVRMAVRAATSAMRANHFSLYGMR